MNAHTHFCPVCQSTWNCTDAECHPDGSEFECPSCDVEGNDPGSSFPFEGTGRTA